MRRRFSGWLVGLLLLMGMRAALAQDVQLEPAARTTPAPSPIQLSSGQFMATLDGKSRYWIDPGATRTVEQVEAAADALPWASRKSGRQYRIDNSALWFQFDAVAQTSSRWYLQIGLSGLDRAQLYYRDPAGHWITQEAGDARAVSQWPLPGRVPTFELSSAQDTPIRYWLRVQHERFDFAAPIAIYSQASLLAGREREQFLLGAYFGLAALIAVVAAANAFAFRDRNFGVYAVYVLAMGAGQAAYLGVGAQHFWEQWLEWNRISTILLPSVSAAAALWFVRTVTEPARFSRALDATVWLGILALLVAVVVDAFVLSRLSVSVVTALVALSMVLVALLIAMVWLHGDDPDI
ncbi:MAG: 7TM diverse intracellular signaling domain-containing protein, partial [Ramlibacter sp.]